MRLRKITGLFVTCAVLLTGCGGGGSSSNASSPNPVSTSSSASGANAVQIIVDAGPPTIPGGTFNEPFVTIIICAPTNPTNCQTIDHVLVDTGSSGLRILSSVLSSSLASALPQQTDASNNAIAECAGFADGYAWGPVKKVNLQVGGETANSLSMQLIGAPAYANVVPQNCSGSGIAENTVATFGANGVLGIGPMAQDCGGACVQNANAGFYYTCSSSCQPTTISLAQQLPNPITLFASDNNGVIISLPTIPAGGATSAGGTMIFGVGTQSNNGLGSAKVYTLDPISGYFTTIFNGVSYPDSLLDTGSNGLFFNDSAIPQCSGGNGFYCPPSTLNLSAVNQGLNGTNGTVNFSVGSESNIASNVSAFSLLAGTNGDPAGFDWGLPFFFGRNVYVAIEGKSTPGGVGPYFAY